MNQLNVDSHVITRHNHFTYYVMYVEVELWTVVGLKNGVCPPSFLESDVNLTFEFSVG